MEKSKINVAMLTNGFGLVDRGSEVFSKHFYDKCYTRNDVDLTLFGNLDTKRSIGMDNKNRYQIKIPGRHSKALRESYLFNKSWYKKMRFFDDFDVILNNSGFPGCFWLRKYRRLNNIPFVQRVRGPGKEVIIEKMLRPDGMIFLNKHQYQLRKPKNGIVIPNGIDTKRYINDSNQWIDLSNLKRPIILSCGAIAKVKRHECTINAISELGIGTFLLVGSIADNRYFSKINTMAKKKLGKRYVYLGEVDSKRVDYLYQMSDVLAHSSISESFGIVYLEAMASSLPIVTVDDSSRRDIIGDCGYYCDVNNKKSYSDALFSALSAGKSDDSVKNVMKYDWDSVVSSYISYLKSFC